MSAGDTFLLWQFPLHNGEAFGLPSRLVILLSGLSIPLLYVTGLAFRLASRAAVELRSISPGRAVRSPSDCVLYDFAMNQVH
jgi:uncharacterized iron-regulated membrane protein